MARYTGYPSKHDYMTFRDHNEGVFAYEDAEGWDQIRVLGEYETVTEAKEKHPDCKVMTLK